MQTCTHQAMAQYLPDCMELLESKISRVERFKKNLRQKAYARDLSDRADGCGEQERHQQTGFVLIVSHSVFGNILTNRHLHNCEMMAIDEFVWADSD